MSTFSHSKLGSFEQCPLKYKFQYIDKLETEVEDTVECFMGSLVHQTLEKLHKDLKFQKLNTLKELLDFYNSEWKKNWNDSIVIVKEQYDQENYRKMGDKYITDYYNRYSPFNQTKTIGLETQNMLDLGEDYKFHVRIDRLSEAEDGVYEIHDYKTNNSLPIQGKLDSDRQLAMYSLWVLENYPDAKKVRLIWHFLAFDKEMSSERTPSQLEELRKEVIELIKKVEKEKDFKANVSALCDWCEFQPECPNFKHLFEIEKLPENEYLNDDGVKLVNQFAEMKEEEKKVAVALEKLKKALIRYAEKKKIETVYGSDVKASVKCYPRLKFPGKNDMEREKFDEIIRKIGLWDKLSTVDTYELAKMINNNELHEEFLNLLEKFVDKDKTIVVRLGKK